MTKLRVRPAAPVRERDEAGLTTAEYAVGTLGAVTIAGVLLQVGSSSWFRELIRTLMMRIPDIALGFGERVWIFG